MDRKHYSFFVQVIGRRPLNADGNYAQGLEILNQGWWVVCKPSGSCINKNGSDKEYEGDNYGFLLMTPVGTNKGLEDVDADEAQVSIYLTWGQNLKWGSKVINFKSSKGVLLRTRRELSRVTRAWVFDCANWAVERVIVVFEAEIANIRLSAHFSKFSQYQ